MKNLILLTALLLILSTGLVFSQPADINAVCIQGLKNGTTDTLIAGSQIIIDLIYTNGYDCRQNINNLYKLSSPDSATWSNIDFDCYYKPGMELMTFESFIWNPPLYPWDGISPDYFLTYYNTVFGPGWVTGPTYGYTGPLPWSYPTFYLTFYLDQAQAGKHLVLDSMVGTGSNWVWQQSQCGSGTTVDIHPDWGGPYEFYIVDVPKGEVEANYPQATGFSSIDTIIAGRTVTIPLSYSSEFDWDFSDLINCYQLSSSDGIFWTDLEAMPIFENIGALTSYILSPHPDDIVGLRFMADEGNELEGPFETDMGYLTFKTTSVDAGKTITVDAYVVEGETWLWYSSQSPQPPGYILPGWIGENTLVVAPCCNGTTGNTDCSPVEDPDISDITRLIDFLYISHVELCCPGEADVDDSGGDPDISDITALINHLYLGHDALPECSESVKVSGNNNKVEMKQATGTEDFKPNWMRYTDQ